MEVALPLRISFVFSKGGFTDDEIEERRKFWDSPEAVLWFKKHGYTLYQRFLDDYGDITSRTVPSIPCAEFEEASYPYAGYDTELVNSSVLPLATYEYIGKVVFAQDSQNRHVAIKLVPDDTDEYRILRYLSELPLDILKENCILPVLEFLPIEGFWFVIMPRWGSGIMFPSLKKVYEVLDMMHSSLKSLSFLHKHNISHGDVKFDNVVVNHFADCTSFEANNVRPELRAKRVLSYAMFDFDYSLMLPSGMDQRACRLPYQRSWGTFNTTMDTAQGEFDFNPFVLDVGALGVQFCSSFQHLCGKIHFLAPLLDRMTTRILENRFTASEALDYFEKMYSLLTDADLQQAVHRKADTDHKRYYTYDRWALVPPEFAKEWAGYKEPPIPWTTIVLRRLCKRAWVYHLVAHSRWLFFKLQALAATANTRSPSM